jgi:hypothetical protein
MPNADRASYLELWIELMGVARVEAVRGLGNQKMMVRTLVRKFLARAFAVVPGMM